MTRHAPARQVLRREIGELERRCAELDVRCGLLDALAAELERLAAAPAAAAPKEVPR